MSLKINLRVKMLIADITFDETSQNNWFFYLQLSNFFLPYSTHHGYYLNIHHPIIHNKLTRNKVNNAL